MVQAASCALGELLLLSISSLCFSSSSQLCLRDFEMFNVEVGQVVLDTINIINVMHYSVWPAILSSSPCFLKCSPVLSWQETWQLRIDDDFNLLNNSNLSEWNSFPCVVWATGRSLHILSSFSWMLESFCLSTTFKRTIFTLKAIKQTYEVWEWHLTPTEPFLHSRYKSNVCN